LTAVAVAAVDNVKLAGRVHSTQSYEDEKLHRPVNNVTKRYPTLPVIVHQLSKKSEIITEDRSILFRLLQEHPS
jgi:hypothetical protein